ncbi:hypothetical protein MVES_002409 [Malassezia vespertilionis]|uniref:TAFII28-like protein domain-containing protein n=1 Tax=Malassezia vespertilionis TaxID=2020962 RepID=A0A2N1JA93_9BASI|nr:hypothetical protein MVES_002409 [Malassezia vespertilionis]
MLEERAAKSPVHARRSVTQDRRSESRPIGGHDKDPEPSDQEEEDVESDGAEVEALAGDDLLSQLMDEEQLERHMASRRGTLNKAAVRKLVNHVMSQSVNQHIVMAASGVGKVFVGEIVELARAVQQERRDTGPLLPVHLSDRGDTLQEDRAVLLGSANGDACFR